MATAKKLPQDLDDRINELRVDLQAFINDQNEAYDERSEKWQESPAGEQFYDWLANLQQLSDELEAYMPEPLP